MGVPLVIASRTSGWDMPRVLARKLKALSAFEFPLDFEVVHVALTSQQAREFELPSTPLKESEKRASRWKERMGVEQTEIDAPVALRPELLREIAQGTVRPYFDETLARRVSRAEEVWRARARTIVDPHADQGQAAGLDAEVRAARDRFYEELEEIDQAQVMDGEPIDLPPVVAPEPDLPEREHEPLIDSCWPGPSRRCG